MVILILLTLLVVEKREGVGNERLLRVSGPGGGGN